MGKKKGKKGGDQKEEQPPPKKEEKQPPPTPAPAEEPQGAVGGVGDGDSQKKKKQKQKTTEPAGGDTKVPVPPQSAAAEEPQGAVGDGDGQKKKKQKQKTTEPAGGDAKAPVPSQSAPAEEAQGALGGTGETGGQKKKKQKTPEPEGQAQQPPSQKQQKKKQKTFEIEEPAPPPKKQPQQRQKKEPTPETVAIQEPEPPASQKQKKKPKTVEIEEPAPPPKKPSQQRQKREEQPPQPVLSQVAAAEPQEGRRPQHEQTPPPQPQTVTPQVKPTLPAPFGRGRAQSPSAVAAPPPGFGRGAPQQAGRGGPGQFPQPPQWGPSGQPGPPPGMHPGYRGPPPAHVAAGPPPGMADPRMHPGYRSPSPAQVAAAPTQRGPPRSSLTVQGPTSPLPAKTAPKPRPPADSRSSGDSITTITTGMKNLNIPSRKMRDRCGTKGMKIVVETNHLALDLSRVKNNIVTHYDVAINPDTPKRLLRVAMNTFLRKHFPDRYPAFDGKKNLYSSGQLPFGGEITDEVEVMDEESSRGRKFTVAVKYASQVDLFSLREYMRTGSSLDTPQEAIQAIDVVLRSAPAFSFVQVGRSFFTPPREQVLQLGDGLELWYGFFQSAILGWKPFVNIDVAHKGFPSAKKVVPDIICEILKVYPRDLNNLNRSMIQEFSSYIRGLKVDYQIPDQPTSKRTYKVNGIVKCPMDQRFEMDNGKTISVMEYFEKEKKVRLCYPYFPCLHVGSVNRPKPIYVPAELCTITKGQVTNRKMNEIQTSNMIKQAATSTDERKRKIYDALRAVGFNSDPCVQEFGLSVSEKFEKVEARILEPPRLEYGNNPRVTPSRGVWRASTFVKTNELTTWTILNLNRHTRDDQLVEFGKEMQKMGRTLGMNISQPYPHTSTNIQGLREYFRKMKERNIQLVVVVVPDRGDTYAKVKQTAELFVGVLTQCIKGRTMMRMNPATCSNILLKVNSKLNGINHTLATRPKCLSRPVMIVGADVTHPSPDQTDIPSVAAVCASHDPKAFQYNIQIRLQPPRVEIIEDLQTIMKEQLMFFYRKTNYKPERIIFFRDGVSEGQFSQVLNSEVRAIRAACSSLNSEYKPKVTFLVVQKRHHTRFFPTRPEDCDGKNRNVPPGTVVDKEITHPTEVDFYLVSHASIQGVSRPTKYRLLWNDDVDMTEDEIEEITYYLCHMFSRCTRSVSYPAPTYNAHLAAYRARVYLEGERIKLDDLQSEQRKCTVMEDIIAGHPMFFV